MPEVSRIDRRGSAARPGLVFQPEPTLRLPAAYLSRTVSLVVSSLLVFTLISCSPGEGITDTGVDVLPDSSWTLVWSDEFDGSELDPEKWSVQVGDGCAEGICGWGNNELQWYQADNIEVSGGFLTITAREERVGGQSYTSARIRTKGKGDWTYGRIDVRARLPTGQGLWPAIWMLPSDDRYGTWAAGGEIDIMELVGHQPDRVYGTLHYGGEWPDNVYSGAPYVLTSGTFADRFHTFTVEWEEGEIRWYVDGRHYQTQTQWHSTGGPFPAPFDQPFHLLLNVAVGGNWPGNPDARTTFPQSMVVEYVRVYSREVEP
ncbi:MAG: glycoside hydrolase family 16 protein [Gemmatimonadales bacterium]|nr:MAG: glycoside hydrolase family 16 protein [Gemmatimonadales bacterium]